MAKIPKKLKKDGIFQAIFDIRFTSGDLPEVIVGKLASHSLWKGWDVQRLPISDIPATLRHQDPNLQFQPLFELKEKGGRRLVRIGDRSFSCVALPPYPGWTAWQPELNAAIDVIYQSFGDFTAKQLGLRYINTMTPDLLIKDTSDLRISVNVAGAPLQGPLVLNYQREASKDHIAIIRIASRDFVLNPSPPDLSEIIDIDVSTLATFSSNNSKIAVAWLGDAHTLLKEEFFRLFTDETIDKLAERND